MSTWMLGLVVLNIFLLISTAIIWVRLSRRPKDDPRLTRGLQLLQSKIAVLEDLTNRTDSQVKQLIEILEERGKLLQRKIIRAEEMLGKIEHSMAKSLDVAEIFQDKIPHEEIVERSQTSKYVLAAKLAHDGNTVEQIMAQVNLPQSEVEFISKVNRDELTFNPDLLPEWAKPRSDDPNAAENQIRVPDQGKVFLSPLPDLTALDAAQKNFDAAVDDHRQTAAREDDRIKRVEENVTAVKTAAKNIVQKVQFPRLRL